jgi:hypothetical protein
MSIPAYGLRGVQALRPNRLRERGGELSFSELGIGLVACLVRHDYKECPDISRQRHTPISTFELAATLLWQQHRRPRSLCLPCRISTSTQLFYKDSASPSTQRCALTQVLVLVAVWGGPTIPYQYCRTPVPRQWSHQNMTREHREAIRE